MREYGVTECECGRCRYVEESYGERDAFSLQRRQVHRRVWEANAIDVIANTSEDGFCVKCDMKLGIDERGPWRERMVPRAALEMACRNELAEGMICPLRDVPDAMVDELVKSTVAAAEEADSDE